MPDLIATIVVVLVDEVKAAEIVVAFQLVPFNFMDKEAAGTELPEESFLQLKEDTIIAMSNARVAIFFIGSLLKKLSKRLIICNKYMKVFLPSHKCPK